MIDALNEALRGLFLPSAPFSEEELFAALRETRNLQTVQATLEGSAEPQLKLALIESLNKALNAVSEAELAVDTTLLNHVYTLLDYMCHYARQLGPEQPVYLQNTACNLFGQQIKNIILAEKNARPAFESLGKHFASSDSSLQEVQILLNFFNYCLLHVTMSPQSHTYFVHRRLLGTFEQLTTAVFLEKTASAIKRICGALAAGGNAIAVLLLALGVLYRLLCYPFSLNYYDYSSEMAQEEVGLIVYPESFASLMEDRDLIELLAHLFTAKLSQEVSLETLRILGRMASSRLSLFTGDEEREYHRQQCFRMFPLLVQNAPLSDRTFQVELVDYGLRCLFVFGFRSLAQRAELRAQWECCWAEIGLHVIRSSTKLADPVMAKYVDYLRKSIDNGCGQEPAARFITAYCENFFRSSSQNDFFPREYLNARNFPKIVAKRFDGVRAVFCAAAGDGKLAIAQSAEWLSRAGCEVDAAIAVTRIAHFLLMFTSLCVVEDYKADYFTEGSTGPGRESMSALSLHCFELLGRIPTLCDSVPPELRRSGEMATLFFLEHFLVQVSKNLSWNGERSHVEAGSGLFISLQTAGVCANFEQFFATFTDKVFSNLALGDATLRAYSIAVLRTAIDRVKKSPVASKLEGVLAAVAEKLFAAASLFLAGSQQLKLRSQMMMLLPPIFLDNYLDDYIGNAQMLLRRLEAAESPGGEADVSLLLHDAIGMFKTVTQRKIFTAVCRIFYPRLQSRLQAAAQTLMSSQANIVVLLTFYGVLLDQLLAYDAGMTQEVLVQVVTDSCSFVGLMAREVCESLRAQPQSQLLAFIVDYKRIVKRLLSAFSKLLRYAGLSFLVLHTFGSQVFSEFVRNVLALTALLTEAVLAHFPQLRDELVALINELGPVVAQIAPELPAVATEEYLRAVSAYFTISLDQLLIANDQRNLSDESSPSNTQAIILAVFVELHETQRICTDKAGRIEALLQQTAPLAAELAAKAMHYMILFNCSYTCTGFFFDIVYTLLTAYHTQGAFDLVVRRFVALSPGGGASAELERLRGFFVPSLLSRVREEFKSEFMLFVQEGRQQKKGAATHP